MFAYGWCVWLCFVLLLAQQSLLALHSNITIFTSSRRKNISIAGIMNVFDEKQCLQAHEVPLTFRAEAQSSRPKSFFGNYRAKMHIQYESTNISTRFQRLMGCRDQRVKYQLTSENYTTLPQFPFGRSPNLTIHECCGSICADAFVALDDHQDAFKDANGLIDFAYSLVIDITATEVSISETGNCKNLQPVTKDMSQQLSYVGEGGETVASEEQQQGGEKEALLGMSTVEDGIRWMMLLYAFTIVSVLSYCCLPCFRRSNSSSAS